MITCYLRYVIDLFKLKEFEAYPKMWIPLVENFGTHHGYFMPHEGADNIALALFSFPSLAAYESYRSKAASDPAVPSRHALARRNEMLHQLRAIVYASGL